MKPIVNRYLSAFYCEDLRYEESGKVTAVGINPGGVPIKLPQNGNLILPKLCVLSMFETPIETPLKSLSIELRLNNSILHKADIPNAAFTKPPENLENGNSMTVELMLEFGHLSIKEEGRLRLVAIADSDEIYMSSGLMIVSESSPTHEAARFELG